MPAYLVVRVTNMSDPTAYGEYVKHTPRILEKFGGRFIARGGETVTLEGPDDGARIVLIEFDSVEDAKAMYNSPEYQAAKAIREGAGDAHFVVTEGYPDATWQESLAASKQLTLD